MNPKPRSIDADVVVVGGGSSGCVLASRLSEDPNLQVVLLEAGGSNHHPLLRVPAASGAALARPEFNWGYQTQPDNSCGGRVGLWHAGKRLGGGGAVNGMMFIRGHRADYDSWAREGNSGWSYEDLLPYFRRMECNGRGADEHRGGNGPLAVSDIGVRNPLIDAWVCAVAEAGYPRCADLNAGQPDGVDYCQANQRRGRRHSAADAFLDPHRGRSNLRVYPQTVVQRITFDGVRANGVIARKQGEILSFRARAGVVLSAGSIASPKLLWLSGVGPGQQLQALDIAVHNDLPGVGKNLQEHAGATLKVRVNAQTMGTDRGWFRNIVHGLNFLARGQGPLSTSVGHAHAFVRTHRDLTLPNLQLIMSAFSFEVTEDGAKLSDEPIIITAVGQCRPRSRGSVALQSNSPEDPPLIRYELLGHSEDLAELLAGLRIARTIHQQPSLRPYVVCEESPGAGFETDSELESFVRDTAFPMYHPSGTCRMGTDEMAVVDAGLRVRGADRLWVADASIMPALPSGNTNATAMVIGERASDLIANQIRAGTSS